MLFPPKSLTSEAVCKNCRLKMTSRVLKMRKMSWVHLWKINIQLNTIVHLRKRTAVGITPLRLLNQAHFSRKNNYRIFMTNVIILIFLSRKNLKSQKWRLAKDSRIFCIETMRLMQKPLLKLVQDPWKES